MIPNTLANTGAYAGLWGHLKSIEHAIERALNSSGVPILTELDRDRLQALIEFLQSSLGANAIDPQTVDLLDYAQLSEPNYSAAIDLKQQIKSLPEFVEWQKTARQGYEVKLQRLIQAIEHYLSDKQSEMFLTRLPVEEFAILRAIVHSLLSDAETALY